MLIIVAWILLGFPTVERVNVNGQMCDVIDSEFLRNLDLGVLHPEECGEAGIKTFLVALIPTTILACIFTTFWAIRTDKQLPPDDYEDLRQSRR